MARPLRHLGLGLALLVFLSLNLAPQWGALPSNPYAQAALQTAARTTATQPVKLAAKDLYDFAIRQGLTSALRRGLILRNHGLGQTPFHKLARTWHTVLLYQLRTARIPEAWKTAAAEVHKKLGGRGDFLNALSSAGSNGRDFNLRRGLLRDEFISYALFFLKAFVPERINECVKEPVELATKCIAEYEEPLQAALISTLTSFFHFVVARSPSSRIVTLSFIFAAVSSCPFGYLTEPNFVYGALLDSQLELLKPLASMRHVASAKPCPAMKKALLHVFMINGVTPGDMMRTKNLIEEFTKIPDTTEKAVSDESKAIEDAGKLDEKELLKKDSADDEPALETAEQVLSMLVSYLDANDPAGGEGSLSSRLGDNVKSHLEADNTSAGREYLDRVRTLLEGQKNDALDLKSFQLAALMKDLSDAVDAVAKENPQNIPLLPAEGDSREEAASSVLEKIRGLDFHTAPFLQPKEDS